MDFTPRPLSQKNDIGSGATNAVRSLAMSSRKTVVAISAKALVHPSIGIRFNSTESVSAQVVEDAA